MQIDSNLQEHEAIQAKPGNGCTPDVLQSQRLVTVQYYNFDGVECFGQLVVHESVVDEVKQIFEHIHAIRFPIAKVVPIADTSYMWDDDLSCDDNNTSAFNYRRIAQSTRLSNHSFGLAIDINPMQNPFIKFDSNGEEILRCPKLATYITDTPGTLLPEGDIVLLFKKFGWKWGGDWTPKDGPVDYQHFEKYI